MGNLRRFRRKASRLELVSPTVEESARAFAVAFWDIVRAGLPWRHFLRPLYSVEPWKQKLILRELMVRGFQTWNAA